MSGKYNVQTSSGSWFKQRKFGNTESQTRMNTGRYVLLLLLKCDTLEKSAYLLELHTDIFMTKVT